MRLVTEICFRVCTSIQYIFKHVVGLYKGYPSSQGIGEIRDSQHTDLSVNTSGIFLLMIENFTTILQKNILHAGLEPRHYLPSAKKESI